MEETKISLNKGTKIFKEKARKKDSKVKKAKKEKVKGKNDFCFT